VRRSVGILGFVAAATSIFRVVSLPQAAAPRTSTPPVVVLAQATCNASVPEESPLKPVLRIFKPQFAPTQKKAKVCSSWDCVPKHSTDFLFASLADPEQTHLSLDFDRALESLMWAVEDDGYAFESYWLPWTLTSEKSFPAFGDQQCVKKQKEARRKEPGLREGINLTV
jgi:hypothetical protein